MSRKSESVATAQDMANWHRIGVDTVRRKVQTGEWPGYRIGRLYRFTPAQQDEIEQILSGEKTSGYDKDRIAEALRKLSA